MVLSPIFLQGNTLQISNSTPRQRKMVAFFTASLDFSLLEQSSVFVGRNNNFVNLLVYGVGWAQ